MATAEEDENENAVKCLWIGDSKVGKSCLLITYENGIFPIEDEFLPTGGYEQRVTTTIDGETVTTHLQEVPDTEYFQNIRPLEYLHKDAVVVCFSVVSRTSFDSVKDKWCPELRRYIPGVPVILLGTKVDLRRQIEKVAEDKSRRYVASCAKKQLKQECVTSKQGSKLAKELKIQYLECSALTQDKIQSAVEEVIRLALEHKAEKTGIRCVTVKPITAPCSIL